MSNLFNKKGLIVLSFLLLLVGILARVTAYSPYLTYVDSYKYLLQAQSFNSQPALEYVTAGSSPFAKWGFSLVIVAANSLASFQPEQFVVVAKVLNIILSLVLALLALNVARKNWLLAVPFFLSPLFFSYSSYIISEYLTLLLVALGIIVLNTIDKETNKRVLLASLGVIMGFLPLVRIEMAVVSIIIGMYMIFNYKKQSLWGIIPGFGVFLSVGMFLAAHMHTEFFLVTLIRILAANWMFTVPFLLIVGIYYVWLYRYRDVLVKVIAILIMLYLTLMAGLSFTLTNALVTDPVLYVFVVGCWGYMLYLLFWKKVKVSQLFAELVLVIFALILTYSIFNKDIDRYALTLLGLMLLAVMVCLREYKIVLDSPKLIFPVLCMFAVVAVRHVLVIVPEPSDYQQYVVLNLPSNMDDSKVYMSGFIYLADVYFRQQTPMLADRVRLEQLKSGDMVLFEDSLFLANPNLYNDIKDRWQQEFVVVTSIKNQRVFNYSSGLYTSGNDIIVLRKI